MTRLLSLPVLYPILMSLFLMCILISCVCNGSPVSHFRAKRPWSLTHSLFISSRNGYLILPTHLSLSLEGSVPVEWLLHSLCKRSLLQYEWWGSDRGLCLLHNLSQLLLSLCPHWHLMSGRLLTSSLFTTMVFHLWSMEVFTLFLSW